MSVQLSFTTNSCKDDRHTHSMENHDKHLSNKHLDNHMDSLRSSHGKPIPLQSNPFRLLLNQLQLRLLLFLFSQFVELLEVMEMELVLQLEKLEWLQRWQRSSQSKVHMSDEKRRIDESV